MPRPPLFLVLLALIGLPSHRPPPLSAQVAAPKADVLRPGMSPAEVRSLLGAPERVSRQIILFRTREQWHYGQPPHRLTFDSPRGTTPRLVLPPPPDRANP